jgi:glucuronide carrier protein
MISEIFRNACILLIAALAFYHFKYVLNNMPFLATFLMITAICGLLGSIAAPWIGLRLGKRNTYWLALSMAAISCASARYLGTTAWSFSILFGFGTSFIAISSSLCTALFSDTVVYGEWKTGKNIRALTMGLLNLPIKIGVFIRSAVVTIGLTIIGFVANVEPSKEVVDGIASLMIFSPTAFSVMAAVIFFFGYKMEESQVAKMQEDIAAKSSKA